MTHRRNRSLPSLTRLETRDVPNGTQLLAIAEDSSQSRVAVYSAPIDHFTHSATGASPDYTYRDSKLLATFTPYPKFHGGVRLAIGDVNGDGIDDVVTAPGFGGGSHIKVYDGAHLLLGQVLLFKEFFAFDSAFRGGAFVAIGQVDSTTPQKEIIVGAGESGGPHVRIFSVDQVQVPFHLAPGDPPPTPYDDFRIRLQNEFFAFDATFRGGVRVAAGDVNGDGRDEVIAAAGPGGGPDVRVFDVPPLAVGASRHAMISEFFAYDASFHGGVYVAAGDMVDTDGSLPGTTLDGAPQSLPAIPKAEIITGPGEGGGPDVKVFSLDVPFKTVNLVSEAFLGSADSKTGARVGLTNINGINGGNAGTPGYPKPTIYVGFGAAPPSQIGVNARPYGEYRIGGLNIQTGSLTQSFLSLPPGLSGDPTQGLFVGV